jgi:hypothetical protein
MFSSEVANFILAILAILTLAVTLGAKTKPY